MRAFLAAILGLLLIEGCNQSSSSPPPPATAPVADAATQPATAPTTRPVATLEIDGREVHFPAARIVVRKKAGGMNVILCSDDPPNAIQSTYTGNSFMLEMKLDVDDAGELPAATWQYTAPNDQPQDAATGIFLDGARRQMQPADVKVAFAADASSPDHLAAIISGTFLLFDPHDTTTPVQKVEVHGRLDALLQQQ